MERITNEMTACVKIKLNTVYRNHFGPNGLNIGWDIPGIRGSEPELIGAWRFYGYLDPWSLGIDNSLRVAERGGGRILSRFYGFVRNVSLAQMRSTCAAIAEACASSFAKLPIAKFLVLRFASRASISWACID
jgi:hypothetical protein